MALAYFLPREGAELFFLLGCEIWRTCSPIDKETRSESPVIETLKSHLCTGWVGQGADGRIATRKKKYYLLSQPDWVFNPSHFLSAGRTLAKS